MQEIVCYVFAVACAPVSCLAVDGTVAVSEMVVVAVVSEVVVVVVDVVVSKAVVEVDVEDPVVIGERATAYA
jgi:hypothetical protein